MQTHFKNGLQWLTFSLLAEEKLIHGSFTRHGGISPGALGSLNFGKEDSLSNLQENKKRALEALNIKQAIACHQVHSEQIFIINEKGPSEPCDGLLTQSKGLGLLIKHADCQAALFYDPICHALAAIHCGWRGNVQNVYKKTIAMMSSHFGSKPENLLVCITPSLGPTASEFIHYKKEFPEPFWQFQFKENYFNLWELARWQLLNEGVLFHHIEIAEICTYNNPKDFYSYRRNPYSGRHATIACLL